MKARDSREVTEAAVSDLIEQGLAELPLSVSPDQISKLTSLISLLSEWAGRISLTGHKDPLEMTGRLLLDAAALSHALPELNTASRLADLGSGVGFPGLPIAILRPDLEIFLVESRLKRHHLQREIRRKLDLTRVIPVLGRSNEVEIKACDVVVAQAMTQPKEALDLMLPWARPGGLVVLPAAESSVKPFCPGGLEDLTLREYHVPTTGLARRLWIGTLED